jgi:predicted metalloprotease with PDZ domain
MVRIFACCLAALTLFLPAFTSATASVRPIELAVDATDVIHGVYHVEETIPVSTSVMTLRFVKWLPGHHAPSGRIDLVGGLRASANGKPVAWTRDAEDIFLFRFQVPAGAHDLHLSFDFMTPLVRSQGRVSMTPAMLELEWDMVVFYPAGTDASKIQIRPEVTLPSSWQFATALSPRTPTEKAPRFAITDLATLIDSPLLAAPKITVFDLGSIGGIPVRFDLAADRDAPPPVLTEARLSDYRAMVRQIALAFGDNAAFDRYDLLVTVSDVFQGTGWEHLRSAEVGTGQSLYRDWRVSLHKLILPHEFLHSWNGKFRRPEGLRSPDFGKAMDGRLLWVYEGLTHYYAILIGARSSLLQPEEAKDFIAGIVARQGSKTGRGWRPMIDTTAEPAINPFHNSAPYEDLRLDLDAYYDEAVLVWLEVDARIRELTNGKRTLDDFARRFFHADAPTLAPKFYALDELVSDLNSIAPYDWRTLFRARIFDVAPESPSHGIELAGWRLVRNSTAPAGGDTSAGSAMEEGDDSLNLMDTVGLAVNPAGEVGAVLFNSPAYAAGLVPTAKLLGIDGQPFSIRRFRERVARSAAGSAPIVLTVSARGEIREANLPWTGGLTYPHLERISAQPDLFDQIFAPLH